MAAAIAAAEEKPSIDLESLWAAFLHLASSEAPEAAASLNQWKPDWQRLVPHVRQPYPAVALPLDPSLLPLVGPLGYLAKSGEREFSPTNFLPTLQVAGLLDRFGAEKGVSGRGPAAEGTPEGPVPVQTREPAVRLPTARPKPSPDGSPGPGGVVEALEALRNCLHQEVLGQSAALDRLIDYLQAALLRPLVPNRLRGSALVFGPQGCGKSYLVERIERWVKDQRAVLPVKRVVYLEGYLPGVFQSLRHHLEAQPEPGVLVLGEFEKYGSELRDVLLEGLSRAELQLPRHGVGDQLRPTPLHGWVVLLVGNVGARFWGRLPFKEKEILPSAEHIREALEEEAIQHRHLRSGYADGVISRAFLDRIEAFVPMCQLRYADLAEVLNREIATLTGQLRASGVDLEVDDRARELLLLGACYKRGSSARQVLRAFAEHLEAPARRLASVAGIRHVVCECTDLKFAQAMSRATPRFLVIDDEHREVRPRLAEALGGRAEVIGVPEVDEAIAVAARTPVDLVFLDMYFGGAARWRDYLSGWKRAQPDTPVVVFSGRAPTGSDRLEMDRHGGVIGFVSKELQGSEAAGELRSLVAHADWQARVRSFERAYRHGGDLVVFDVLTSADGDTGWARYSDVACLVSDGAAPGAPPPVLAESVRLELEELVDLFLDPQTRQRHGLRRPRGVLLFGPPGNGKTMVARELAGRMRCNFLAVAAKDFSSRWAGVAAERMSELFAKARVQQPCVVFVDEIDAVAPCRGEGTGGGVERDQNQTVATLLTELDGFDHDSEVFVIGATNRRDAIDPALLRPGRLDRHIEVPRPGLAERRELMARLDKSRRLGFASVDLDWASKETYGLSGAELVEVVDSAVLIALRRWRAAGQDSVFAVLPSDVRDAVDRVRYGPRAPTGSVEQRIALETRERTAWHEAGHLVARYRLSNVLPSRVSIVRRGDHGGFVRLDEEDFARLWSGMTRTGAIREIAGLLAGGRAETRRFGEHATGVSDDHRKAVWIAGRMVADWGMGSHAAAVEAHRALTVSASGDVPRQVVSSGGGGAFVTEVAAILDEAQALADKVLEDHSTALEAVVALLLEQEDVGKEPLVALLGSAQVTDEQRRSTAPRP